MLPMGTSDAMDFLLEKLKATKNNGEFFQSMGTNGNGSNNKWLLKI